MTEQVNPKETVILVHGTWASPVDGKHQWYQQAKGKEAARIFVTSLNAALERHGSSARCWAHAVEAKAFEWSGNNSWIDRTHAAASLASQMRDLQDNNWRCHVVAHSHGGNALAEAIYPAWRSITPDMQGRVVTLGTPFIDTVSSLRRRQDRWKKIVSFLAWTSWAAASAFFLGTLIFASSRISILETEKSFVTPLGDISLSHAMYALIVVAIVHLGYYPARALLRGRRRSVGWDEFWRLVSTRPASFLAIGSRADEVWQILHHLTASINPFAPDVGLRQFLRDTRHQVVQRLSDIDKINGYPRWRDLRFGAKWKVWGFWLNIFLLTIMFLVLLVARPLAQRMVDLLPASFPQSLEQIDFYTLYGFIAFTLVLMMVGAFAEVLSGGRSRVMRLSLPLRWAARHISSFAVLPQAAVSYFVRTRVWSVIQEAGCGLESYRFASTTITTTPRFVPATFCKYEDLPSAAERRALARRDEWVGQHFGELTGAFSNLVVTATDVGALLKLVSNDLSLVHAAYYTDDDCIDRIARWIAGKG